MKKLGVSAYVSKLSTATHDSTLGVVITQVSGKELVRGGSV